MKSKLSTASGRRKNIDILWCKSGNLLWVCMTRCPILHCTKKSALVCEMLTLFLHHSMPHTRCSLQLSRIHVLQFGTGSIMVMEKVLALLIMTDTATSFLLVPQVRGFNLVLNPYT